MERWGVPETVAQSREMICDVNRLPHMASEHAAPDMDMFVYDQAKDAPVRVKSVRKPSGDAASAPAVLAGASGVDGTGAHAQKSGAGIQEVQKPKPAFAAAAARPKIVGPDLSSDKVAAALSLRMEAAKAREFAEEQKEKIESAAKHVLSPVAAGKKDVVKKEIKDEVKNGKDGIKKESDGTKTKKDGSKKEAKKEKKIKKEGDGGEVVLKRNREESCEEGREQGGKRQKRRRQAHEDEIVGDQALEEMEASDTYVIA